jgi:hypothetical protein
MAVPELTPAQQQAIQQYLAKYPNWWKTGRVDKASPWGSLQSPGAKAWMALSNTLKLPEGYRVAPDGEIQEKAWYDSKWGALGLAGLEAAGMLAGGAAVIGATGGGAGAAGAAGAAGTGEGAGAAGAGTALADVGGTAGAAGAGSSVAVPTTITGLTTPGVGAAATSPAWTVAGSGLSGASAASTAGTVAAKASLWGKIAPAVSTGVGAAADIYGAKLQADANRDAADAQARTAREALDWEKSVYGQRQQQLAPTINVGNSARVQQAALMGLSPGTPSNGWNYVTPQTAPNAVANPQWTTQSPTAPAGTVAMYDPSGKMGYIPQKNVQAALNAGGRMA